MDPSVFCKNSSGALAGILKVWYSESASELTSTGLALSND
jgi:hypothetical protein